jgi:hypothetical protein
LGAVMPFDRPSEFTALPRTTASTRSPSASAAESRLTTTTPQPSARAMPSASAENGLQPPSGAMAPAWSNVIVTDGESRRFTPATTAVVISPLSIARRAWWSATRDDEHAVSVVMLGPRRSRR